MGQIAGELKNRQKSSLPSNTKASRNVGNSGKEQCQAVTLRNGKLMAELRRLEKKTLITQTLDNLDDQPNNQPTNQHLDLTEEHQSTTQKKKNDE